MNKSLRLMVPLAVAALSLAMAAPAFAAEDGIYQATLNQINESGGSGTLTLSLSGNEATITESYSGLAETFMDAPYPHVQHIHVDGTGRCPDPSADANGDGIVDTVEGQPAYGEIGTTLSTEGDTSAKAGTDVTIAPSGSSTEYSRTITLDDKTADSVRANTAVIVVHGLDPEPLSDEAKEAKSNLVPELPLAATSPALCGSLNGMPTGGPDTGSGSTAGVEDLGLLAVSGGLLAAAGVAYTYRRRSVRPVIEKG